MDLETRHKNFKEMRETLGANHLHTLNAAHDIARIMVWKGWTKESLTWYKEILDTRKAVQGKRHPETLGTAEELVGVFKKLGWWEEASKWQQEVELARRELARSISSP
jgi:hypothetical protein